jgi:sulfatase maturation enzyme AslB (radical SAM superfamily)
MADWNKIRIVRKKENMQVGQIVPKFSYNPIETNDLVGIGGDYSVTFRITEACDLTCNYCHWHSGTHYKFEDVTGTIDKLFEFFVKQGFRSVVFYYHGGEPTRHPKIVEILKYIHQRGEETGIKAYNEMQTNLTIGEKKLREMLPYCDKFNVSFHYLDMRVKNKLAAFDRNWEILKELGVTLHTFDVMMENVERGNRYFQGKMIEIDPDDFYARVIEYLKYDKIINCEMIYGFCHYVYPEDVAEKHMEFYKKYNKTEQKYEIDGEIYTTNDLFKLGVDNRGWHCAAGTQSITINGDGNVFNCGIHMTNYIRQSTEDLPFTNLLQDQLAVTKMSILYKSGTKCRWDYCGGDFYLKRKPFKENK